MKIRGMRSYAAIAHEPWGEDRFEFGRFRLDPGQRILWRDEQVLPLGPKVVHTLAILVRCRGQVVSREELIREVWGGTVVEENSLAHNISVLRKALKEDGAYTIETVPRRGYRFCQSQQNIPASGTAINFSGPQLVASGPKLLRQPRRQWVRLSMASAILFCLVAAAIDLSVFPLPGKRGHRRSVAVVGFANLSRQPEFAWLSPALTEMMATELAAGGKLLTIPDESVARARVELKLGDRDGFSAETLGRLRQDLRVDVVVSGAYALLPVKGSRGGEAQVRLDLRVQDASNGETLDAISEVGEQSGLFDLVARAGERIRQDAGARGVTPEQAEEAKLSVSSNPQALQLYAQGIERLRSFDALGAREFLQQAAQADPKCALAHSALAEALGMLGYDNRSREEAKRAFELSGSLSREEQLAIEGRYRMATRDRKSAVAVYKNLFHLFPDNVDYGLELASAQTAASDPHGAIVLLRSLHNLPRPAGEDPRISLKESEAWKSLGDFAKMEAALSESAETAKTQGALLLLAQARSWQCAVQRIRAENDRAAQSCREAQNIYAAAGDRRGEAETLLYLGDLVSSSDAQGAIRYFQESLTLERQIGYLVGQGMVLSNIGTEYYSHGDHAKATNSFQQALAIFRELDDKKGIACLTINLASELVAQGDLEQAKRLYQEAMDSATLIDNKHLAAMAKANLGNVEQLQGNLDAAKNFYQAALTSYQAAGSREADLELTKSLGEIAMAKGDLETAHELFERAVSSPEASQEKLSAAEVEMDLDELSLEQNHSADIEQSLRQVFQKFRIGNEIGTNNAVNDQALSLALLARCLLTEGKTDAAVNTIERAVAISKKADPDVRLSVGITAARIHFAVRGKHRERQLLESLARTIAEAHKFGYLGVELEARLALGEVELKSGAAASARSRLQAVERDASRRGLALLARKAKAAA